jgi:hypothetical protein
MGTSGILLERDLCPWLELANDLEGLHFRDRQDAGSLDPDVDVVRAT